MSGFLSSKYLKYRDAQALGKVEHDLACQGCGYNLRGLNYGRNCPECAAPIEPVADLQGGLPATARGRLQAGLGIAAACLFAATAARVAFYVLGAGGAGSGVVATYLVFGLVVAVAWTTACWLVTPGELDRRWRPMRPLRLAVRASQPLWVVAYVLWLIAALNSSDPLAAVSRSMRVVAGLGAVVFAYLLVRLAESAERETAARRLNAAVWLLAPATLIPQVFRGSIAWFEFVLLGLFLVPWLWIMVVFALGVLELQRHVAWTAVHAQERHTRSGRLAETRRAMDDEVNARIRPLPPDAPDIPLEPPE